MVRLEHTNTHTTECRIAAGNILRTFGIREKKPMIKLFNSYIKSKLEYCSVVWSPADQGGINEVEKIQQAFTKK